jgi:hypothetical protein
MYALALAATSGDTVTPWPWISWRWAEPTRRLSVNIALNETTLNEGISSVIRGVSGRPWLLGPPNGSRLSCGALKKK